MKICHFGIHSWMDLEKLCTADWIQGQSNICTHTNAFLFKKSCLVTNSGGLITGKNVTHVVNLPLVDTRYVTPLGHYVMTLMLFCLYWMKEAAVFRSSHFSLFLLSLSLSLPPLLSLPFVLIQPSLWWM